MHPSFLSFDPAIMRLFAALLVALLVVHSSASLYDKKRGLKVGGALRDVHNEEHPPFNAQNTYGLDDEQIEAYSKQHDVNTIVGKHKEREGLKDHPEVQRFLKWQKMAKARLTPVCASSLSWCV